MSAQSVRTTRRKAKNTSRASALPLVLQTPRMTARPRKARNKKLQSRDSYRIQYDAAGHEDLPHVVKFSGGRSSGMLLFLLLENGILQADRGDVVIFNNTSAEHPETYRFTALCKRIVEEYYGIPFFWLEFQTYEDARAGAWTRLPSYKLVTSVQHSEQKPNGYSCKGELFEELLSWSGFVPNQFSRTCTKRLKLESTKLFLRDWLACKEGITRQGHHSDNSRLDDKTVIIC